MESLTFLVVEDRDQGAARLVEALLRKFPGCACVECAEAEVAVSMAERMKLSGAIVRRAEECDAVLMTEQLRIACPEMPIIVVGKADWRARVVEAGATAFLFDRDRDTLASVVTTALFKSA